MCLKIIIPSRKCFIKEHYLNNKRSFFTKEVNDWDLGEAVDETTTDDRSGGGGGKTGGLTFRIDLEVIGQCSPSLTASVGPPKGRCMIVNTNSLLQT